MPHRVFSMEDGVTSANLGKTVDAGSSAAWQPFWFIRLFRPLVCRVVPGGAHLARALCVALFGLLSVFTQASFAAGNADVLNVDVRSSAPGVWHFSVTVAHPDTGWEDYADGWDVVLPDGTVVKPNPGEAYTRTLWHPHVNEQPFTRSQGGIRITEGIERVTVRAHDKPDGFGGVVKTVVLP